MYLRSIQGNIGAATHCQTRPASKTGRDIGAVLRPLNTHHLEQVTVLEMPESGGT
jgi:hypothetical protein